VSVVVHGWGVAPCMPMCNKTGPAEPAVSHIGIDADEKKYERTSDEYNNGLKIIKIKGALEPPTKLNQSQES
jgi:hypothetical protein